MNRQTGLVLRLYPRAWRERYGDEFMALLEDSGLRMTDLLDILLGAMDMQLRHFTVIRIVAAFVVVGVLVGLGVAASRPQTYVSEAVLSHNSNSSEDMLVPLQKALKGDFAALAHDIQVIHRGKLVEVSFRSTDANQAHRTNAAIVGKLIEVGAFGLVTPPTTPQKPMPPMYSMAIGWGVAAGLALGSLTALVAWARHKDPAVS